MKGITEIVLTDVNTGEVNKYVEENMFTNALDNMFNRAPWYFNNDNVGLVEIAGTTREALAPVVGNALGGILLFPQTIEENANILFASADNKPTGLASFVAYSGDDSRRGNLNTIESGAVTGGYRFVFDFSTSQSNGTISCIGLTTKRGSDGYLDGGEKLLQFTSNGNYSAAGDSHSVMTGVFGIGADDNFVYFAKTSGTEIYRLKTPKHKLSLLGDIGTVELLGNVDTNGTHLIVGNELWIVSNKGNSSGSATLNIDKYSLSNFSKSSVSLVVAAPLKASSVNQVSCVVDGYMYLQAYNGTSVYKFNIENVADVIEIPDAFASGITNLNASLIEFNHGALGRYTLIEADGTAHKHNINCIPVAVDGVWMINTARLTGSDMTKLGATVLTPALCTINNLENGPITKTASQTMKITYTVYEE